MNYISTPINDSAVIAFPAAKDIEGAFVAVEVTSSGVQLPATAGAVAMGLLVPEEDIKAGDTVTVQIKDMGKWTTGAEIEVGDPLTTDTSGKCVKATEGDFILGFALEAAASADATINVQITKSGYFPSSN